MCQLFITKDLSEQKDYIISYFIKRGEEVYYKVDAEIATNEYKKKTKALNKSLEHLYTFIILSNFCRYLFFYYFLM